MNPKDTEKGDWLYFLFFWSLIFGGVLTLLRLIVLSVSGSGSLSGWDFLAMPIGFLGQAACATLLGTLVYLARWWPSRVAVALLVGVVIALNAAAFHYEAVFGRLPSSSLIYYLRETGHLTSSVGSHSPAGILALEVGLLLALFAWLGWSSILRRPRPKEWPRPRYRVISMAACWLVVGCLHIFSGILPDSMFWGSRLPLLWFAQSTMLTYSGTEETVDEQDVWFFQQKLGHRLPFGGSDPDYPLCAAAPLDSKGNGRSVLLVILESVGNQELDDSVDGLPVMPNLQKIAAENICFKNHLALGTKSCQAMPALFAGLPAQPHANMLWLTPLNKLEGLPLALGRLGYKTAYFHGGDLSFEQQRDFLRMVGIERLHELDLEDPTEVYAWGYSDQEMFKRLIEWVDRSRKDDPLAPYFASLFTLGTHDPYILPPDWTRVFSSSSPKSAYPSDWERIESVDGPAAAFRDSLRFLDEQLGAFYQWYLEHEKPRGTILVLVGDHAPYVPGERGKLRRPPRFHVPLIIAGAEGSIVPGRLASQLDVPATLRAQLDMGPGRCDQGLNLLMPPDDWPAERRVLTVSGDQLETLFVWSERAATIFNRITRKRKVKALGGDIPEADKPAIIEDAERFLAVATRLGRYLTQNDCFAPPPESLRQTVEPLGEVKKPFFVSHRGQTGGSLPRFEQNKPAAIEAAISAGFEWVEVDLQITRDGVPVLAHDPVVAGREGKKWYLDAMTLEELRKLPGMGDLLTLKQALDGYGPRVNLLLDLKRQRHAAKQLALAHEVCRLVRTRKSDRKIIVDSFNRFLAAATKQHCNCPVGMDLPGNIEVTEELLRAFSFTGISWVYLDKDRATPELIGTIRSHGLKVMLYTVNQAADLQRLGRQLPDGVITDRAGLALEASKQ